MNKKRYAGLLWTNPDKHDKMDSKGIETVRRDNCLLVRNVVSTCLEKILIERDMPAAVQFVRNTISDLLLNKVDLSLLVISKVRRRRLDISCIKALENPGMNTASNPCKIHWIWGYTCKDFFFIAYYPWKLIQ